MIDLLYAYPAMKMEGRKNSGINQTGSRTLEVSVAVICNTRAWLNRGVTITK